MNRSFGLLAALAACSGAAIAACGDGSGTSATFSGTGAVASGSSSSGPTTSSGGGAGGGPNAGSSTSAGGSGGGASSSSTGGAASTSATSSSSSSGSSCGPCPTGYTCSTANSLPVCRAPSGIPAFSHVFIIMMENTSLSTLQAAMNASPSQAPNLKALAAMYATGSDYHGVAHPSLPNYIALTSGDTQGVACDGDANPQESQCSGTKLICEGQAVFGCSCSRNAMNLGDQLEAAGRSWMAFGEDMGTPCNIEDSGNYAQRHVPFLYYQDIQGNGARCNAHVVDFSNFQPSSAPDFTYIAPNLIDDMHNPDPTTSVNIPDGDEWIGPEVAAITASSAYTSGGLLVVVWDEDDGSGGLLGNTDDPIEIFVMSPYAKSGGYVSQAKANHYSLLATIEDGLGLPRLGNAAKPQSGIADTLADYFPAN